MDNKSDTSKKPQSSSELETETKASEADASSSVQKKPSSENKEQADSVQLHSLFAFKMGMTSVYEKDQRVPVTVALYKEAKVTQIKTPEKEGYSAVQVAVESSKKPKNKALEGHLKKAQFKHAAQYVREVKGPLPQNIQIGSKVSIESFKKGDAVLVSGISKGHGFSGVLKRWGFGGGPAAHGAEKHRTTGSIANTATQGKVFPGKKMPGQFGCDRVTQKSRIVDVLKEENALLLAGSVPGAKNALIEIRKDQGAIS